MNTKAKVMNKEEPHLHISTLSRSAFSLLCMICLLGFLSLNQAFGVMNIPVPNADFELLNNEDDHVPFIIDGSYNEQFGTGAWYANGAGVVNVLLAPTTSISGGDATISGLASLNVAGVISNSASFYQDDIGTTFIEGYTYTLTASIHTAELLDVTALSDAGIGIGLLADGAPTPLSGAEAGVLLELDLWGANSGTLTYTLTADNSLAGKDIGVSLYAGLGSGLANVGALGAVSFDNVALTAVPEPGSSAFAMALLALCLVASARSNGRK